MNTPLNAALKPCPFCSTNASIIPVGRDWWRLDFSHSEECPIHDFGLDVPQDDESKAWLVAAWNTRANPQESSAAQGAMTDEHAEDVILLQAEIHRLNAIIEYGFDVDAQPSDATAQWQPADDAVLLCVACSEAIAAQPSEALTDEQIDAENPINDATVYEIAAFRKGYRRGLLANTAQGKPEHIVDFYNMVSQETKRLDFITGNHAWFCQYMKNGDKPARYRMMDDGEPCGKWHSTAREAIDAALTAKKG